VKVITIDQFGGPEVLKDATIALPQISRDEVLVKVKAVGFNPVDTKIRSGVYGGTCPLILGVDFSGVVEAVGDRHGEFAVGDHVYGLSFKGSYAEYIGISTKLIAKMPQSLSFEEAAAVPVAYVTAFQAMIGTGALQQNRPLFISGGSGGVGSAAIQLARVYRAGPVFTMSGNVQSREYLLKHLQVPSSHILNYSGMSTEEMADKLIEMNQGQQFYFALDFVGGKVKELCFVVADYHGHVASILPEDDAFSVKVWGRNSIFWHKSLSLHMVYLMASFGAGPKGWNIYKTQLKHLASLFEKKELPEPHIQIMGELSAETARKAHVLLATGHTFGKLVMSLSDSN